MHLIKKARAAYQKYWFLLTQLVSRDFKTKYKRSVLGVLWSMLNPLLTMGVQYIVFSELFRWDIDNFAVYLLIGTEISVFYIVFVKSIIISNNHTSVSHQKSGNHSYGQYHQNKDHQIFSQFPLQFSGA